MEKVRVHQIAKEAGYTSKEILEKANEMGLALKSASNAVSLKVAEAIYQYIQTGVVPPLIEEAKPKKIKKEVEKKEVKKSIKKAEDKEKLKKIVEEEIKEKIKEKLEVNKKIEEIKKIKEEPKKSLAKLEDREVKSLKPKNLEKEEPPKEEAKALKPLQRRGLVIVKKKKDKILPVSEKSSTKKKEKISLSMIFSHAEESLKRKKKDKKNTVARKDNTRKMDLLADKDFGDIHLEDENIVIMPDFSVEEKPNQVVNTQNKKRQAYQNKANNFSEGGIQRRARKKAPKRVASKSSLQISKVDIPKEIRLYELADKMGKNSSELISKLFMLGLLTTKNDFLDEDSIEILASEFNIEVNIIDEAKAFDYLEEYDEGIDDEAALCEKAPVVTIMGHVDHGKTSLLDYIRKSRVATSEAGGITQHVGAYMVEKNNRKITFIDTPGHEAFSAMRARGASITDIVIIVVAADDGVKPQTKEAINHAKDAGVPIIIALNKMDKENANPDLVKTALSELGILPTDWGGAYEFVPISAKTGAGIDDLLEIVLLQADILELRANPKAFAKAKIVESSLQISKGAVATLIMENGSLSLGDTVVAGTAYGKVRALQDDQGKALKCILPGECAVIMGLNAVAHAGETLIAMKSDKEARAYAKKRLEHERAKELSKSTKVSIDELGAKIKEGRLKSLPIILKADVQGSLEAIKSSLLKLENEEIKINIVHLAVGGITQSDIELASSNPDFLVIGFNIRPTGLVKEKAKEKGVLIKTYSVIYQLIDDVKSFLSGMMSPIISEEQLGQALIKQVINIPKLGQIAGCMVSEGSINRGANIRLIREGVVIYEGRVSSLKRFKDDVKEVAKGYECGVGIEGCDNMQLGDYIESFKKVETRASL